MYFHDTLNYAQGVMIFEGLENSRTTPPMTDKAGSRTYNSNMKKQLNGLWDIMFPRSAKYHAEDEARRQEFIKQRAMYKKMKEEIRGKKAKKKTA